MSIEVTSDDVLKQLSKIYGTTTDIDLAKKLDVAPQTVSTWRNRNKIPFEKVVEVAAESGVSLDLILLGRPSVKEVGYVQSELLEYLFRGMDDELFLRERIADQGSFDLLCRAYNSTVMAVQGEIDIDNPQVRKRADDAMKDVISLYHSMMSYISKNSDPGSSERNAEGVKQHISHSNIGQAAAGDIHNKNK